MRWLRKGYLLLLLGLVSLSLHAQPEQRWQILIDESASLTINDVVHLNNRFQNISQQSINYPSASHVIWLKTPISKSSVPRWVWMYSPRIQFLDYYLVRDEQIFDQVATGEALPAHSRPLQTRAYLFRVPNDQQRYDAYLRLSSNHPLMSWFAVIDEPGLLAFEHNGVAVGIVLGGLLVLAIYSLISSCYSRSTLGIWLALVYLSLGVCAAANLGYFAVWLPSLISNQSFVADISALLCCLAATCYALSFMKQHWHAIVLYRALRVQRLLLSLLIIALFLIPRLWTTYVIFGAVTLAVGVLTLTMAALWHQGYRPARLLALGSGFFLISFLLAAPVMPGYYQLQPGWLVFALFSSAAIAGLFFATAIGERRQYDVQIQLSNRTQAAADHAQSQARSSFLAKLSHDIRTPMNGVLGMTELLLSTQLSAKQRDYARTISSSGNDLLNLINHLLDIAKLESGTIELDQTPTDLAALIEDCVESFRARASQQHIELITFIQPQVPRLIKCDPARLRQALSRLLQSTFKQAPEGEVVIVAALEQTAPNMRLRIAVQNSSQTLSLEQRRSLESELLAPLYHDAPNPHLDLFSARQLLRLMGGEVGFQVGETHGITVWLSLPLDPLEQTPSLEHTQRLQGLRLLVVDDNVTCRRLLIEQCQSMGISAFAAASGQEALALLRTKATIGEYFDVVLLDQEMPGLSGLSLAGKIKSDSYLNHDLVLIMLTGLTSAPNRINAQNAGIHFVLTKPVAGYTLKATLLEALNRLKPTPPLLSPLTVPQGFKVLVAEDNSISTKVILGMLNKLSIEPVLVNNGLEALKAMQQELFDLVLMDCEMPVMDGFSATEHMRQFERTHPRPRTPIIALTAHILPEHKARAEAVGMDDHLAKPIELSQLRELIRRWIKQ